MIDGDDLGGGNSRTAHRRRLLPLSCTSLTHRLCLFTGAQQDASQTAPNIDCGFYGLKMHRLMGRVRYMDGSRNSVQALFLEKWEESVQQQGGSGRSHVSNASAEAPFQHIH